MPKGVIDFQLQITDNVREVTSAPPVNQQAQREELAWITAQAQAGPLIVEWGVAPWQTVVRLNGQPLCVRRVAFTCDPQANRNTLVLDTEYSHLEADFTGDAQSVGTTEIGITALRGLHAPV